MTTATPTEIAERITASIYRISSTTKVAEAAGIRPATLAKHLSHPDMLTVGEVYAVARVLREDPADFLAPAESHASRAA